MQDAPLLQALRDALADLQAAERDRARAWAWASSGLLEAGERRAAQMQAEREVEDARERLQKARLAIASPPADDRAWGAH